MRLPLAIAFSLTYLMLCGQFKTELRLGRSLNTVVYQELDPSYSVDPDFRGGITIGLGFDYYFEENLAVDFGLVLYQKGFELEENFRDIDLSYNASYDVSTFYLELPVSIQYELPLVPEEHTLFFAIGGFLAIGLGGQNETQFTNIIDEESPQEDLNFLGGAEFVSSIDEDNLVGLLFSDNLFFRRFDLGVITGIGYRYKQYSLRLNLNYSFLPLEPAINVAGLDFGYSRSNLNLALVLAYRF